jgi:hypothetical protein
MVSPNDLDAVIAAVDVVGRSGGKHFEIGYLDDEEPHRWYATATYQGAKAIGEHPTSPDKAADLFAYKVLHGGQCTHCRRTINVHPSRRHRPPGQCVWRRRGDSWIRGCA